MSYRPAGAGEPLAGRWIALEAAVLFAACTWIFFWSLAALPGPIEGDTLFHYRMAQLILERGPWVSIDSLPYTVLGTHGTDQNWFFHLITAPLTLLGESAGAIHLATAIVAGAMVAAFLVILRRNRVPYAPLVCLLMVSAGSLVPYRYLVLRGQDFAVPMMMAILFGMLSRRSLWCGIGAFLFMQGYHAAVILGLFCAVVAAVQWREDGRPDWRTLLAVFYGVILGLVLSPWFPDNVRYLLFHTVFKVAQAEDVSYGLLGSEWSLPPWDQVLVESWPAHLLFFGALLAGFALAARGRMRFSRESIAFYVVTLVFLGMYKGSGWRFAEYYIPFAVLSAALVWRDASAALPRAKAVRDVPALAAVVLAAWTVYQGVYYLTGLRPISIPVTAFRPEMQYVMAHDRAPIVFDSRWWDYVVLFFQAPDARYVAGLDGHFLKFGDPARFKLWYSILRGENLDDPALASTMHDRFAARWAVISVADRRLAEALYRSPDARLRVATINGYLFELKSAGGAWADGAR
ncbi:MAG TPA: hypothetical protein VHP55_11745 [Usitatibacter sp.]|nr:hypothetical protein [Usitatibacter sp.]